MAFENILTRTPLPPIRKLMNMATIRKKTSVEKIMLVMTMDYAQASPSVSQAMRMREMSEAVR